MWADNVLWRHRLSVRTHASQAWKRSSILRGAALRQAQCKLSRRSALSLSKGASKNNLCILYTLFNVGMVRFMLVLRKMLREGFLSTKLVRAPVIHEQEKS